MPKKGERATPAQRAALERGRRVRAARIESDRTFKERRSEVLGPPVTFARAPAGRDAAPEGAGTGRAAAPPVPEASGSAPAPSTHPAPEPVPADGPRPRRGRSLLDGLVEAFRGD